LDGTICCGGPEVSGLSDCGWGWYFGKADLKNGCFGVNFGVNFEVNFGVNFEVNFEVNFGVNFWSLADLLETDLLETDL